MTKEEALKAIQEAARAGRIEFAGGELVDALAAQVDQVLIATGVIAVVDGRPRAYVSDESKIADFAFDDQTLQQIRERIAARFGITVREDDYVWQVAARLAGIV